MCALQARGKRQSCWHHRGTIGGAMCCGRWILTGGELGMGERCVCVGREAFYLGGCGGGCGCGGGGALARCPAPRNTTHRMSRHLARVALHSRLLLCSVQLCVAHSVLCKWAPTMCLHNVPPQWPARLVCVCVCVPARGRHNTDPTRHPGPTKRLFTAANEATSRIAVHAAHVEYPPHEWP